MRGSERLTPARRRAAAMLVVAAVLALAATAPRGAALAGAPAVPRAAAQQPTFASRTDMVRIDVLVKEDGRPVPGLQPADFEVRDNGVRQQVDVVSFDQAPLAVIFAFDVSESVRGQRLLDLRSAAKAVLAGLRPGDEAALVTFNAAVSRPSELTADHQRIAAALDQVAPGGGTALVDAVYAGMKIGARETSRVLMIVFSDGLDISSWLAPDAVVRAARRSDIVAYAVTAGAPDARTLPQQDYERAMMRALDSARFLRDVADVTGGHVLEVDANWWNLDTVLPQILQEFRARYLVGFVPRNVSRDGWHDLQVSIRGHRGATVKARSGYQAR